MLYTSQLYNDFFDYDIIDINMSCFQYLKTNYYGYKNVIVTIKIAQKLAL